jgi:nicotinate-nucleotide adenylyltransferase
MSGGRIGIFGGTFDPIHLGHLVAAVNARHALALDRLLLVVANVPWQKVGGRAVAAADDRYAMVEAAVGGVDRVEVSAIEIDRGGPSYTADTLATVAADHPGAELFCVVGADVARSVHTWDRADEVRARATLAVVNRPGAPAPTSLAGWRVELVRVVDGRPLDFLVPEAAIRCIRARGLYAAPGS